MSEKLFSFGGHFWICGQLVWGLEPTIGDGCSDDTIASRLDISGSDDSWLHNSHQFKTIINIIFFKKALQGFQTSQICDTQAYVHHLITCANQKSIGSGNRRFSLFHLLCIQTTETMFVMHLTSSQAFFMGKALGTRGQGRVALVTVKSGVAYFTYFRIGE